MTETPLLAPPGSGSFALDLADPSFFVLVGTLAAFVAMWFVLRAMHPNRKRGLEGYLEAAGVSLAFLAVAVALVIYLAATDPSGNRTSFALFETILSGYWLAVSLPVVTVGSSVQARSRGAIRWFWPSIAASGLLFVALFGYYYLA